MTGAPALMLKGGLLATEVRPSLVSLAVSVYPLPGVLMEQFWKVVSPYPRLGWQLLSVAPGGPEPGVMASFTWDASLRQGVPFVSSMITVGAGNRACPASPLPGWETQANWCGSDELQFCPLTGAEGLLATAVLDELRPFPDTVMVSSCNPLTPAVADAPEGHGERGLRRRSRSPTGRRPILDS